MFPTASLLSYLQGTHVIIPPYPIGVSVANYGPTAASFIPERWLEQQQLQHLDALREAAGLAPRAAAAAAALVADHFGRRRSSSSSGGVKLPDNLTFSSGPRDCVGQSLAKLEMQSMLATLVGHFELTPGPELQKHLAAAAAAGQDAGDDEDAGVPGSEFNAVAVLNELSVYHVTLQSKNGMALQFVPRC
jgi:cytochrome P450